MKVHGKKGRVSEQTEFLCGMVASPKGAGLGHGPGPLRVGRSTGVRIQALNPDGCGFDYCAHFICVGLGN